MNDVIFVVVDDVVVVGGVFVADFCPFKQVLVYLLFYLFFLSFCLLVYLFL